MPVGIGLGWVGVGEFWLIWARVGKGGLVWMGQTDKAWMGDISRGWVCERLQV